MIYQIIMVKEINVVYPAHIGQKALHYNGPEGKVWLSRDRNDNMPNVFIGWHSCRSPRPNDNFIMLEPIVVSPMDFDVNYLCKFNKIFSNFGECFKGTKIQDKIVNINYGTSLDSKNPIELKNKWIPWEKRINGVIIVAGGKSSNHPASIYSLRETLGDLFHKHGFQVARYGGVKGKKPPYFKGILTDKISEICKYRFHLCSENTYHPQYSHNYLTEKLPHSIFGGAVPLYIGCYNIENLLPKNSFFDLRKFITKNGKNIKIDEQNLISTMKSFSKEDFHRYHQSAFKSLQDPFGLLYLSDMKVYYKKMLESL